MCFARLHDVCHVQCACYMYHDSGGGPRGVIGGRVVVGGRVTPSYGAKTCLPPPFRLIPLKINTHLKDF